MFKNCFSAMHKINIFFFFLVTQENLEMAPLELWPQRSLNFLREDFLMKKHFENLAIFLSKVKNTSVKFSYLTPNCFDRNCSIVSVSGQRPLD